ncbi:MULTISPECIES: replicative DNA helicase [Moraxella]|uniref:Replicative DNA helicase n=1 Tax=Moraxella lacunata TaxID=477 RepID=A0A1B8PWP2_MORLA|nr:MULTISPECIES: replicative DNA helicase [Moraxella]MBE9577800.1 replicative DNA helicase [Moraxella sp. K1664]MBE9587222.1 replicative DNA helicase [Moraxella sp. K1630]MBE9589401.1 replicative DNA helicase [Moraxella sp. K127]MBE9595506.1 replicative DNA helicase [Moraxella sp. K2450]MDH9217967.1 replicative DNA helicase [Moraxella lacunata]
MTEVSTPKDTKTTNDDLLTLQPPHNMDIERALLASLMSIDDSFEKIDGIVKAEDFYGERHRQIFNAINHLSRVNQPYDTLMVHDFLSQQNLLAMAGGEEYLMQINQSPATLFNLIPYAERVREFSVYRQLIKSANTMLNLAYHPKKQTVSEILDVVEADIFRINEDYSRGTGKQGVRRVEDILQSVTDQLVEIKSRQGGLIGLRTPFEELNNKTQGLQRGDLIILAARPSMGKTTFAMNLAQEVLVQELPVVMFSMEMPAESILMRMMSGFSSINQSNLRSAQMSEDEWVRLSQAMTFFQNTHLYIDDRNNLPPSEVRSTCRRIAKNHPEGLGMIVVDYLQLMKVPGMENNRVQEIGEISRSLKALAREMNCPVIALSQLNRSLEQRTDKRPMMADLRESGAIEQDADLIMFIYRDEVYYKDKADNKGFAEIIIGKQRNGPIGKLPLRFVGEYTRFDNLIVGDRPDDYEEE